MSEPGTPPVVGVIGGSGLYEIEGLEDARWEAVTSPFGATSGWKSSRWRIFRRKAWRS